jgi:hypothetical protein
MNIREVSEGDVYYIGDYYYISAIHDIICFINDARGKRKSLSITHEAFGEMVVNGDIKFICNRPCRADVLDHILEYGNYPMCNVKDFVSAGKIEGVIKTILPGGYHVEGTCQHNGKRLRGTYYVPWTLTTGEKVEPSHISNVLFENERTSNEVQRETNKVERSEEIGKPINVRKKSTTRIGKYSSGNRGEVNCSKRSVRIS